MMRVCVPGKSGRRRGMNLCRDRGNNEAVYEAMLRSSLVLCAVESLKPVYQITPLVGVVGGSSGSEIRWCSKYGTPSLIRQIVMFFYAVECCI
jgi:hypothetical protein